MLQWQHCPSPAAPWFQVRLLDKATTANANDFNHQPQISMLSCPPLGETPLQTCKNEMYPRHKARGRGKAGENNPQPLLPFELIFNIFFFKSLSWAFGKFGNAGLGAATSKAISHP